MGEKIFVPTMYYNCFKFLPNFIRISSNLCALHFIEWPNVDIRVNVGTDVQVETVIKMSAILASEHLILFS